MKQTSKEKENRLRKAIGFFFLVMILIFLADHIFKLFVKKSGCFLFICLKYVTNTGAAFSLFAGFSWARMLLIVIGLFILIIVAWFYFKYSHKNLVRIALALIFAGTISNLLDRIFMKYIIDYISLSFWPAFSTFNIADLSNVVGVILLIIFILKKNGQKEKRKTR